MFELFEMGRIYFRRIETGWEARVSYLRRVWPSLGSTLSTASTVRDGGSQTFNSNAHSGEKSSNPGSTMSTASTVMVAIKNIFLHTL